MVTPFRRLFGKSLPAQNYAPIDKDDETTYSKEATNVSSLFFVSPAQLWIGSLISRVNKAGEIEQDGLPHFKRTATKLRALYEPLREENGGLMAFVLQFEIGGMLILGALLEIAGFIASLGAPLILHSFLQRPDSIPLAWTLVAATFLATIFGRAKDQVCRVHAAWIECMLRSVIFEKSLKLSPAARTAHPSAKIININAVDVGFLTNYVLKIHDVWSAPLQIIGIGILTVLVMGWTSCVGFALVIVIFVCQTGLGKRLGKSIGGYIEHNDRRIGFLRDMLNNIKSVKASAMEDVFQDKITAARNDELGVLRYYLTTSFAMFTAINQTTPYLAACAAFLTYAMMGEKLTADVVFPCLAYFQLLHQPVTLASLAISRQFSVKPSLGRVRDLLTAPESRFNAGDANSNESAAAISFQSAVFEWPSEEDGTAATLDVGSLDIPRGQTTIVIGPNGSGKTSLLQSILGEMILSEGTCVVDGSVAYCSQEPWIMSGDLRDNIVFNYPRGFERARYNEIVHACGLDKDFAKLPGGIEHAVVGEAGTNLSGGQRARVSVARALYSDAEILLLDDPLSALDAHVRSDLFESIRNSGKTVILVTLHTSYVSQVDNVIVVDNNKTRWSGPRSEFLLQSWTPEYVRHESSDDEHATQSITAPKKAPSQATTSNVPSADSDTPLDSFWQEEERARGAVNFSVLSFYIRQSGGAAHAVAVALMTCLLTAAKVLSQYWFVWWIAGSFGLAQEQYMGIFLGLTLFQGFITAAVGVALVGSSLQAARRVHETILGNLIGAPLWFFQQNPTGRILNRMSRDLDSMDSRLMNAIDGLLAAGTTMFASVAIVASSGVYLFGAVVPFLLIVGWCLQRFRVTAREVQRLDSVLQSPALSIVSESLRAPSSVRAYGAVPFLVHGHALDRLASSKICRSSLDTWVTFRSEMAAATVLVVLAQLTVYGVIPHISASLALGTATTLARNVYLLAWAATDLEIQLNSVERLQIYHEGIPREDRNGRWIDEDEPENPLDSWPEDNTIDISKAHIKYKTRKTPALDHISIKIGQGQKVGLVGRTGSGKSTLLSAIARLVDINDGSITIGGVNTSKIPPRCLRRDVITLPQESLIFQGSLRENLDPYSRRTDGEIWESLAACQMSSVLRAKYGTNALQQELSSDGTDLSAGQRQLVCAARVLLERPSVLLVDEASANVDFASDVALQRAWQALPASTTMITIAHRASSLAWMDRVLVMDNGKLVEDGKPRDLLSIEDGSSYYRTAIDKDGPKAVQNALQIAMEWDAKKQGTNV